MTPRDERELERRHLLSLLAHYGPMHAASLADRANDECLHDAFDGLPTISRRGIGQKLAAMWEGGLVTRAWQKDSRLYLWSVTDAGRELAALDPYEPASLDAAASLPVGGGDGRHRLKISIDDGVAHSELICPERGCVASSTCGQCGRDVDDTEAEPCYDCPDRPSPCWLQTWAENEDLTSYTADQPLGVFAIDATYDDELVVTIVGPVSSSAGDDPDPVELGYGDTDLFAGPAGDEAREALAKELYRRYSDNAGGWDLAADDTRESWLSEAGGILASLSSPLPGAGDVKYQWAIFDKDDEPVCTSLGPDDHVLRAERWDEWMPERAPHRLRGRTCTTSAWFDAPAPADDKETTR